MKAPRQASAEAVRFGKALQEAMHGYGLVDVAKATGTTYGMLQQVLYGRRAPSYAVLLSLVKMFPVLLEAVAESAASVSLHEL